MVDDWGPVRVSGNFQSAEEIYRWMEGRTKRKEREQTNGWLKENIVIVLLCSFIVSSLHISPFFHMFITE